MKLLESRKLTIDYLLEDLMLDATQAAYAMAKYGFKGFENYTDEELIDACLGAGLDHLVEEKE